MDQHSARLLSADQLREPPAVLLATGMIASELDLSCGEAFERLHERALGAGSLSDVANKVVQREIPASCGEVSPSDPSDPADPRAVAARRERWAIRDASDLLD